MLERITSLDDSYHNENIEAIVFILNRSDESMLPHTWGSASFKARLDVVRSAVSKYRLHAMWIACWYPHGARCNIR